MENHLRIYYSNGYAIRDAVGRCVKDNPCNRSKNQAYGKNKRNR